MLIWICGKRPSFGGVIKIETVFIFWIYVFICIFDFVGFHQAVVRAGGSIYIYIRLTELIKQHLYEYIGNI